jgi:DNA-binding NarL/FixJ family response regulator
VELSVVRSFSGDVHAYGLKNLTADRLTAAILTVFHGDTWMDASLAERLFRELLHSDMPGAVHDHADGAGAIATSETSSSSDDLKCSVTLTQRELQVLSLIVQGLTNQAIADRLVVSLATAKAHVRSILCKLSVSHRTEAAVEAIRRGLV